MRRNQILISCLLAWLAFWPMAWMMPRLPLFDIINSLSVSIGIFVLWAYLPGVVAALRKGDDLDKAHFLILGIFITWIAMISRTNWLWGWRYLGEPEGGLDHVLVAFIAWLVVTGGVFHLLAPRVLDGNVPRAGWSALTMSILFGLVLGVIVIFMRG
jgi:hypothetical protein